MAYVRVRHAAAGAIAFAAVALLPLSSAGAHPLDCTTTVGAAPTAALPASWAVGEDGCANEAAAVAADDRAARAKTVRFDRRKDKRGRLTQVGHDPLLNRGMNAAIALNGDYAYIGSRTDGGHAGMPQGGIMVVDISDP